MKNRITYYVIMMLLVSIPMSSFARKVSEIPVPRDRTYIGLSAGKNSSNFRDFATSPLIYRGSPNVIGLSRIKMKDKGTNAMGLNYSFGNYSTSVGAETATSQVKTVSAYYSRMYDLRAINKWQVQVGGVFNTTANLRQNSALLNNGVGLELFANLLGSVSISGDVSRRKAKDRKFIFLIPYRLKPRTRTLGARFNLGLINSSFRNGYVYADQSALVNENKAFDNYQFSLFSGIRLSTSIDYTIFLNNNAVRLSYGWDAYKTGGDLDKFEMAHHVLGFTFLINTK